ncbi:MAG: protein-disulfide reductase DsbD family protein [Rubricoccaceae bacterium]|nr:protein-disulfide reductase DsbD family protein [Rubricoccaceae bacterium]
MRFSTSLFIGAVLLLAARGINAQSEDSSPHSDAQLVAEVTAFQPGEPFWVGLHMVMDDDWHSYWKNPGDAGQPTEVHWQLPEGFTVEEIEWPFPERIDQPPLASYGYSHEVLLPMRVVPPADYDEDELALQGTAEWLICADICLPAEEEVSLRIPRGESLPDDDWANQFSEARVNQPAEIAGWNASAEVTDGGYTLLVDAPDSWRGTADGSFFFVDTDATLAHAEPQSIEATEEGFSIRLTSSRFSSGDVTRLTGALVAPEGQTWDGTHRALAVNAPVVQGTQPTPSSAQPTFLIALLFAFTGGLILNLMPCVFPILSIKILGFAKGREHERSTIRTHGLLFGLGVVVSFWVLALTLLILRAGGQQLGWGFQLQSPLVVGGLAVLMFALGLVLLGVFEVGLGLARIGGRADKKEGLGGAFLSGVLATIVATPCTAPFMGAALGFAVAQPAFNSMLVFTALGIGMSTPYVLLSVFPAWIQKLPKPGRWMETLKQALAFPLFATAVWLIWVFGKLTGNTGVAFLLLAMTLVCVACWMYGRWGMPSMTSRARQVSGLAAVLVLVFAFALIGVGAGKVDAQEAGDSDWLSFDQAEVDRLVASGQPVFVDFTAAWCLSCQANKLATLETEEVEAAFDEKGVVRFRADWTRRDPEITQAIENLGRTGVPVYALYPGNEQPVLLPEILSKSIVIDALERIPMSVANTQLSDSLN